MGEALTFEGLSVSAGKKLLLDDVSASVAPGQITAVVGPNGAGKSTLLKALAGVIPTDGRIALGDTDLKQLSSNERARRIAYLPQSHDLAWDISVADMVALGRFAYGAIPGRLGAEDRDAVARAMNDVGCSNLAGRAVTSLSGGERSLACLARVLAADTPVIVADEPVAALDLANQYRVMETLASLASAGRRVVVVLHDVPLVAQFADSVLWLQNTRMAAQGPATRDSFERLVPFLFARRPYFAHDESKSLFFRRATNA